MVEESYASLETAGRRTVTGVAAWLWVCQAALGGCVRTPPVLVSMQLHLSSLQSCFSVEPELEVNVDADITREKQMLLS